MSGESTTIARPYAEAAFARALATDSVDKWADMLELLQQLVSDPDVDAFFSSMAEGGTALATVYPDFQDRLAGTHAVVFDDLPQTLDAIRDGIVDATIVQRQYNWGFGAIYQVHRLLQKGLPCSAETTDTGVVVVTKDNVETFATETMDPQMWLDLEAEE